MNLRTWDVKVRSEFNRKLYLLKGYYGKWYSERCLFSNYSKWYSELFVGSNYGEYYSLVCVGWSSRDNTKLRPESCYIWYRLLCYWIRIMSPQTAVETPAVHGSNRKEYVQNGNNHHKATLKLLRSVLCLHIHYVQCHFRLLSLNHLFLFLRFFFHKVGCYFHIFTWMHLVRSNTQ